MMTLETQQRGLLDLVKSRGGVPKEPYLRKVAGSAELGVVREIALWWRMYSLEGQCRFTARLLKRLGCFEDTVAEYFDNNATSFYVEDLGFGFLDSLRWHGDRVIRAVAQSEGALLRCKTGCEVDMR